MQIHSDTFGQGENVVLIHGWGFHSGIWRLFAKELAKNYRVTLIDLPGFGQSSLPKENLDLTVFVNAVLKVSPLKAVFLGWSLGGLIAMAIAAEYPQRINKLISFAASPSFVSQDQWPGIAASLLKQFSLQVITNCKKTLQRFLLLQLHGLQNAKQIYHDLNKELFKYGIPSVTALNAGLKILLEADLREGLSKIDCDQLFLLGRLDAIVPVKVSESLRMVSPQSKIVIIDHAAHIPFLTHQPQVIKEVLKFLTR